MRHHPQAPRNAKHGRGFLAVLAALLILLAIATGCLLAAAGLAVKVKGDRAPVDGPASSSEDCVAALIWKNGLLLDYKGQLAERQAQLERAQEERDEARGELVEAQDLLIREGYFV